MPLRDGVRNVSKNDTPKQIQKRTTPARSANTQSAESLTKKEIDFIVDKLRNTTFKGTEFEQFYFIMLKLQELHKSAPK